MAIFYCWVCHAAILSPRLYLQPVRPGTDQPLVSHTSCLPGSRQHTARRNPSQHKASWYGAHRHGYLGVLLAPLPARPFCHTPHRLDLCQVSVWATPDAMPHTPPEFRMPGSRTATHQAGVPEARLPYRSVSPRNEALAQLQNSQLSEVITGFH